MKKKLLKKTKKTQKQKKCPSARLLDAEKWFVLAK